MQFTLMFSLAWSTAIAFTRAMSPPFEAMYAASLGIARIPSTLAVQTMEPLPVSFMAGIECLHMRNAPFRLTCITLSHSSSLVSTTVPTGLNPALLKRQSSFPYLLSAASTQFLAWSAFETSVFTKIAFPPILAISFTVLRPPSSLMSAITTLAPFFAKRVADALPIPDEPPVTIATLPARMLILQTVHRLVIYAIPEKQGSLGETQSSMLKRVIGKRFRITASLK